MWGQTLCSLEKTLKINDLATLYGGGSGIRTRDTISGIHTFQACAFNHSATPPSRPRKIGESGGGFKCFVHVGSQESDKGVHCTDRGAAACSWKEPISREVFVVFLRVIGGILLLAGIAALGFDLWQYVQGTGQGQSFHLTAAGELWYRLSPGTLNLTQAVTQRYVLPELWDSVLLTVLLWPAALVLGVPGLVLLTLGSFRRRSRSRR